LIRASDFRKKEIINLVNNEKLGYICDFEICTTSGEIATIIIPKKTKGFYLTGKGKNLRIPWQNITGIGEEIILVRLEECE